MANNDAVLKIGADVSGALGGINQLIGAMPGLGGAIAGGFSIAAVTSFVRASIDAADQMGKLAQKTGISTEVLSGYQRAASLSDVSTQALAGAFKALAKNMGEGDAAFTKWGVSITDANGKMLSTDAVFAQIADRMQQMQDGPEKAAMAMELLGKAGNDLIPMLNEGSVGLERYRLEAERTGNVISGELAEQSQRFNDNLTELGMLARGVGNDIAAYFLPALNGIVEFINAKPDQRLSEINEELAKLRGQDDYTGFADTRIAKLEEERAALDRIVKLEQQRKALAGAAALGDTRDARDRRGEADSQAGAIADFEGKRKTGKGKAKAEKAAEWKTGADVTDSEGEMMSLISEGMSAEKAAEEEAKKQQAITDAALRGQGERYAALTANDETDRVLKEEQLAMDLETLAANRELWLLDEATYQERKNAIIIAAAERQSTSLAAIAVRLKTFEEQTALGKTKTIIDATTALTAGLALHSKKAFEVNKAASIANAVVNTGEMAVKAYNALASIYLVGPILGAIAAAGAISFGMSQVNQIRGQQFGGGGSVSGGSIPSMPSYSASKANQQMFEGDTLPGPAQPVTVRGTAEVARQQISVTLVGSAFNAKTIAEDLIPLLNEASENGATIKVQTI